MRLRPLFWLCISLLCFIGAFYFWNLGEKWKAEKAAHTAPPAKPEATTTSKSQSRVTRVESSNPSPIALLPLAGTTNAAPRSVENPRLRYRLHNTDKTAGQLAQIDQAILLANALIDSSRPLMEIPEELKSDEDPGAYVVQARGPATDRFRAQINGAGGSIVAYIPNNAYLVRATSAAAQSLAALPTTQLVIPFEPYYKLDAQLLASAIEHEPLQDNVALHLVLFPDAAARNTTLDSLNDLGATVLSEGRSPFGPIVTIKPAANTLQQLAALTGVQAVQIASKRIPANDLSRPRIGVAINSIVPTNYLNLSGSNVLVNVNDTGIDATHQDLTGRVFASLTNLLVDTVGHGTHVAGIIAGDGKQSLTVSNAYGSIMPPTNGQFRGMAPLVKLYAQDFTDPSDFELQEGAARTNALISNNSWGYSTSDYDIAAASYDAAVRDSLPGTNGSQPLIYVFAAGNSGNGSSSGEGATAGTVLSPGTAKNVITVGAIEQMRKITNSIQIVRDGETNSSKPWIGITDSDNQVASFSSRGNVGVSIEGDFGRFKPDVVAPGVFVVSTRSAQWDQTNYYNPVYHHVTSFIDDVKKDEIKVYPIFVPYNTVQLSIWADALTPADVDLPIYIKPDGNVPTLTDTPAGTNYVSWTGGQLNPLDTFWLYGIGNSTNTTVHFRATTDYVTTNDFGNYFTVLSNMNEQLGPYYRYESGTSMAAPAVSGVLALMEDYFTNRLKLSPSPALMKAMLINGARTVNAQYDLQVQKELNDQGWGLVNLTNSLPATLTNSTTAKSAMVFFDQSPTNALATADRRTVKITVDPAATATPLRVTLVWTDPPGNPAAGIKLVNDLDLVVTNLDDPALPMVYFGNDIPAGSSFNFPFDTNSVANWDRVNNVENIFIRNPLGTNYSVTVIAHRVNVNAVPGHTNNVVQDYALVISTGDGETNAVTVAANSPILMANAPELTVITNDFGVAGGETNISGQLLMYQRTGANPPLLGNNTLNLGTNTVWGAGGSNGVITLGVTNQWHFYVMTNTTTFSNAAFATFLPPTLSLPRMGVTNYDHEEEATRFEADIDMYVSTNADLLRLDPAAIAGADKSLRRGGNEFIVYSNSVQNDVYYIGVRAEDQQAAEYAFFGAFSLEPFSDDDNGVQTVRGINVPAIIPDGTPSVPGGVRVIGIAVRPIEIRKVVVTNELTHQNMGDLFGVLTHEQRSVVLNNHSCAMNPATSLCYTNFEFIYDDSGEGNIDDSRHTDGPGDLRGFMGERGEGVWFLTEVDNALGNTGRVETLRIRLEPQNLEEGVLLDIAPNSFGYASVDVPPEATNMLIEVWNELPVELFVKRGDFPTLTDFDYSWPVPVPPAGTTNQFIIDKNSTPPLRTGRHYIGIYNPNTVSTRVWVRVTLGLDIKPIQTIDFTMFGPQPIPDDAVSYSTINVPFNRKIARVDVGMAIEHPRISDMALTLLSPAGKRILLFENRGGTSANLGNVQITTNVAPASFATNGPSASTNIIALTPISGVTSGVLVIDFDFLQAPDSLDVYYGATNIYSSGLVSGKGNFSIPFGPGTATTLTIVVNQDNNPDNPGTAWQYTASVVTIDGSYFSFSETTVLTNNAGLTNSFVLTNFPHSELPIKFARAPFRVSTNGLTVPPANVVVLAGPTVNAANGHYYYVLGTNTFDVAESLAISLGGHLATINDAAEDAWVYANMISPDPDRNAWIGLQADSVSGTWSWVSGEPVAYTNWSPGEPNWVGAPPYGANYYPANSPFGATPSTWNDAPKSDAVNGAIAEVVPGSTNLAFYFPEESLKPLVGDNALGEWKLELWDNRAGGSASNVPPQLLSWQLRFIFDEEIPNITPLVHDVPVTNNIAPCQFAYYSVAVPLWASYATNTLLDASTNVTVWVSTNGIENLTNTTPVLSATNSGVFVLSSNSIPSLVPGGVYYIGVQAPCDAISNVMVALKVEFDITPLLEGIAITSTNTGDTLPRYFYYDVSTNATAVSFQLTNMSGNFDLVARRGAPLPTMSAYHYGSFNPGTIDEEILIFTNSTPAALAPGRWYLGVFNTSLASNVFTIVATKFTNQFSEIITLTNGIPYTNSAPAAATQYYRYLVSSFGARVQFEINGPSGDMALVASKGLPLPTLGNGDYTSDNPFVNDELITLFTNSTPVPLTAGDWFLAAVNVSGAPVSYSIKATEWAITGQPITVSDYSYNPPDSTYTNGSFCITWNSLPGVNYYVQGISDLASTNWIAVSPTITATDYTTIYCVPITASNQFFRVVEGIVLSSFAPPQNFMITSVTNNFLLQWRGSAASQYQLQWTTNLAPALWTAFSPTNMTSTNMVAPHSFTNGIYSFLDDGLQTNGPTLPRPPQTFYRVLLLP